MSADPLPSRRAAQKRVLGDLRIFQAVYNDLNMRHELVTDKDGNERWAYVYDGVDPYELEDSAFPSITAAIETLLENAEREARIRQLKYLKSTYSNHGGLYDSILTSNIDKELAALHPQNGREADNE